MADVDRDPVHFRNRGIAPPTAHSDISPKVHSNFKIGPELKFMRQLSGGSQQPWPC